MERIATEAQITMVAMLLRCGGVQGSELEPFDAAQAVELLNYWTNMEQVSFKALIKRKLSAEAAAAVVWAGGLDEAS